MHSESQISARRNQAGAWFRRLVFTWLVTELPENLGNRNDTAKSYFSHLAMETKMKLQEGEVTC